MTDTVKLTVAQVLVRFLAAQEVEARRRARAVLRRVLRHPRTRGPRRPRAGVRPGRRSAAVSPASQRAGDGAHRLRIRGSATGWAPSSAQPRLPVDFATNAASLGAQVIRAETIDELRVALDDTADAEGPVVICVETDRYDGVPNFDGWWEVPVAEISEAPLVRSARESYEQPRRGQRLFLETP